MKQLNAALRERPGLSLVSVCCAVLREVDGGATADVVLAGHPPAFHVRAGIPEPVGEFAPFLGAYDNGEWRPVTVDLEPSDQLVLYTDGVIDTVGEEERFGEDRLVATLDGVAGATDAVARIEAAVHDFARGPQADDIAVIAVERVPVRR
jgi:serine phosphatase RsbU (regulator of sigma subunit)